MALLLNLTVDISHVETQSHVILLVFQNSQNSLVSFPVLNFHDSSVFVVYFHYLFYTPTEFLRVLLHLSEPNWKDLGE